jgi:long-chain acyl-CoA synthetase
MALMGTWFTGRVAVPLNYLLAKEELRYVIDDSQIDTIVTVKPMLDFIGGAEVIPPHINLLMVEEVDFTGVPPVRWPPLKSDDDLAVILYTSGTSGRPKGVMLSHGNLASNVDAAIEHARLSSADTFVGILPQFHSFGLTALTLIPLRTGSHVVYSARFTPKRVVAMIREHKAEIFMAVPSMYGALLAVKGATAEDFKSLRLAISGGEPLPAAVFDEFESRFGVRILEGYGLTETAPVSNWSVPDRFRRKSVGPALPGVEILIVDEQNRVLPPNTDGEVLIDGPNIMKGYFRLPEQTASVFVEVDVPGANGAAKRRFFRTGDIGRIDDEGYLYITGRKKEMLIIAGENVFPREIEEVLDKHPAVRASAVIGKMDELRGELPVAFIELNEGVTFDETDLRSWCRDRLAQYKVPREIHVMEALPRNPTGKIMRRQLKA